MGCDYLPSLRVAGIVNESVVDGPGIRLTVFLQGCLHDCPGCHNPKTHALDGGRLVEGAEILASARRNPLLRGLTFSGGEPFLQAAALAPLARAAHAAGLDVVTYTGYTLEQILAHEATPEDGFMDLLRETDTLVDGPFVLALRTLSTPYVGSSNQRVINVPAALAELETPAAPASLPPS